MSTPVLELRDVSLGYRTATGWLTACEGISFSLAEGERLMLVGASGCGKSTLLGAVAGFHAPHAGQLLLDGRPVTQPGPDRMMVFQEFEQLLPWKSVADNIAYPRRLAGTPRAEGRREAETLIAQVGLTGFADAFPHTLSGGMKMRVAIARALAARPRVLLMDEPFAALDALTRRRMQDELLRLWRDFGFTLLFVTHAIEEAVALGSRILVLSPHPGRVQAVLDVPDTLEERAALEARIHRLLLPEEVALHA
ncbi:ABC transporter ATP-binding protein [Rhodovarius crocodyli]|uniref:ABC transporter ATP-binding protein n=1 Tax=Rhodovarius crocodyli TaxID=1979269 RepID=UPI001F0C04D5|nr:ABC transporter ATP-binding protein [Rhodovarius crocodyli]